VVAMKEMELGWLRWEERERGPILWLIYSCS